MSIELRKAVPEDIPVITEIYKAYVLTSAATMEFDPPGEAEMARRMSDVQAQGLPFFVAEEEGVIAGYGYASPFRPRPGYRFTVEDSIYLRAEYAGRGLGKRLLRAVMQACRDAGCRQMIAVIGGENPASIVMHRSLGFSLVGVLNGAGWKFDRPHKITLMQGSLL
jgi:phosphinothricin acetyltransferase